MAHLLIGRSSASLTSIARSKLFLAYLSTESLLKVCRRIEASVAAPGRFSLMH
jgi:hypothetical protein